MPVSSTVREATDDERTIIARQTDIRRQTASSTARNALREKTWLGAIFGSATLVGGIWLVKMPTFPPAGFGLAMPLTLSAISFLGAWKDRQGLKRELHAIDREHAERGRAVTEYRMVADRIVVVAGNRDDGETWWCFRSDDGAWLVFEDGQWGSLDASRQVWTRDVRVGVDSQYTVVSITCAGAPVSVERRDLQPPDFLPTSETIFWSPPDDHGSLPFTIAVDPTTPDCGPDRQTK